MTPPSPAAGRPDPPAAFREHPPEFLVLDVDGVLTDNSITLDEEGRETKRFHVPDGQGIKLLQRAGVEVALLSGRKSAVVDARARELGIARAESGVTDKSARIEALLADTGADPARTVYVGDDWIDIGPMRRVGLPVAVQNAIPAVCAIAVAVTTRGGGAGAVREVCDWILEARGDYARITEEVSG